MDALPPEETIPQCCRTIGKAVLRLPARDRRAIRDVPCCAYTAPNVLLDEACKSRIGWTAFTLRQGAPLSARKRNFRFGSRASAGTRPTSAQPNSGADDASPRRPTHSSAAARCCRITSAPNIVFRTPRNCFAPTRHQARHQRPHSRHPRNLRRASKPIAPTTKTSSETDIVFLEAIANVISMSRERLAAESQNRRRRNCSPPVC